MRVKFDTGEKKNKLTAVLQKQKWQRLYFVLDQKTQVRVAFVIIPFDAFT
jgi:hypothetical protein